MLSPETYHKLISFQSYKQDLKYADILGDIETFESSIYNQDSFRNYATEDFSSINEEEQESFSQPSYSYDQTNFQTPALPLNNKRKIINKGQKNRCLMSNIQDSDDQTPIRRNNRNKKRREKKDGYPTKNFLPNFKSPHIQYLQKQLGVDYVNSFQIVKIINTKNGVSMKDYQTLYKVEQFEEVFKNFFRYKVLYRQLMLSRSSMKARKVHVKKLSVFEKAFEQKLFERIN